jgi:ferric-dicitrate binding protein FerR (iron transport regulator)
MKQHFSEADLLETYYTKPGESLPVMMHLADCADCAARYERLERKMQSLREPCPHHEKPETFWARQRMSIMRKIDSRRERRTSFARIAAAAAVVLAITATVTWDRVDESSSRQVVEKGTVQSVPLDDSSTRRLDDPWQSDELNDYSSMVAWESWVEEGDQS